MHKWECNHREANKPHQSLAHNSYYYWMETCPGYDSPQICKTTGKYHFRCECIIKVGEGWIKNNVLKETLTASIAERMLYAEKSSDTQFSPA